MAPNETKCDACDTTMPFGDRVNVCLARPSDPAELCAVMYICPSCAKQHGEFYIDKKGAMGTHAFLEEQFENGESDKLGYIWLTV